MFDVSIPLRYRVLTVAAVAAAPLLAQYPALADQASVTVAQSSVPAIAPGSSGRVTLAETNAGPAATFSTLTFTAPSSAKFADTNLYFDNQPVNYVSCALSNGDATLTCSADGALEFPANAQTMVGVDVQVPADAAAAATLAGGSMYVPSVSSQQVWPFAVSTAQDASAATDGTAVADQAAANPAVGDLAAPDQGAQLAPDAAGAPSDQAEPAVAGADLAPTWFHGQRVFHVRTLAGLNIRKGPGTGFPVIGSLPAGAVAGVLCKVNGTVIDGNPRWYLLAARPGWITARYAQNLDGIPPFC